MRAITHDKIEVKGQNAEINEAKLSKIKFNIDMLVRSPLLI